MGGISQGKFFFSFLSSLSPLLSPPPASPHRFPISYIHCTYRLGRPSSSVNYSLSSSLALFWKFRTSLSVTDSHTCRIHFFDFWILLHNCMPLSLSIPSHTHPSRHSFLQIMNATPFISQDEVKTVTPLPDPTDYPLSRASTPLGLQCSVFNSCIPDRLENSHPKVSWTSLTNIILYPYTLLFFWGGGTLPIGLLHLLIKPTE